MISFFIVCNHVLCQEQDSESESSRINFAELYFDIGNPVNSYGSRVSNPSIGFSGLFLTQYAPDSPKFIGVEFNYLFFDSYSVIDDLLIEGTNIEVRDRTSTHELGLNLLGRYYLPYNISKLEFFADMRFGIRWLYAYTSLNDIEINENISSDISSSGFSINLGLGLGLQFPVSDQISLSTKLIYNAGTKTDYYARLDNEPSEFSEDAFQTFNSTIDLLSYSIGLSWLF